MTRYRNTLTINSQGEMHECNFILHPLTSKKWLVTRSGAVFNTSTMTTHDDKTFLTNFPRMLGTSAAFYHVWHTLLEEHCSQHKVFVPPVDEQHHCNDLRGFVVGECEHGEDVNFPVICQSKLHMHSSLTCKGMMKEGILPIKHRDWTGPLVNEGYAALQELNVKFHPALMKDPQSYAISPK